MKSANALSGRSVDGNVLEPEHNSFCYCRRPTSDRFKQKKSHTDLNRIDETRGNITIEEGHLLVNEKTLTGKHTLITPNIGETRGWIKTRRKQ